MIGTGREDAPIAPLFRAFAEYVHHGAAFEGSLQPHHKLDPPLLMALDEVTSICPVPLPLWMADSAGKGIIITAICHGLAQLEGRWDTHGARAIWDTAGVKIILGGDTLEDISRLCGEIDLRVPSYTIDDYGRRARTWTYQTARVLPPELLRMLPEWRALVVRGNLSPVIIRLRMAWRRHDYRRTRRTTLLPQLSLALAQLAGSSSTWAAEQGNYPALPSRNSGTRSSRSSPSSTPRTTPPQPAGSGSPCPPMNVKPSSASSATGSTLSCASDTPDYLADHVKPCWPNHPEARWELTWLYQLWTLTYLTTRHPQRGRRLARPLDPSSNPPPHPGHDELPKRLSAARP
jgi:hypothetical protein